MAYNPNSGALVRALVFIKSIITWVIAVILTVMHGSASVFFGMLRLENVVRYVAFSWGHLCFWITGSTLVIENKENLYKDGPIIIICNHQSLFDVMLTYIIFRSINFRWMAKASLFKIPFMGWGMSGAGYIPVDRTNKIMAQQSLFNAAKKINKDQISVVVFPEGSRTNLKNGQMLPFKKGGFVMAKKANVVIQPITIWGSNAIIPLQKQFRIQRIYRGRTKAILHKPIKSAEFADMDVSSLSKHLRKILESPMDKLRQELPVQ